LNRGLTPGEQAAYGAAREAALVQGQRARAVRLLESKLMQDGSATNVANLAAQLEKNPEKYRQALGDELFGEITTIANAGRTLLMQPGGRELFSKVLTRATLAGAGYAAGNEYSPAGGAIGGLGGAFAPAQVTSILQPHILSVMERLARTRATSGAVAEGAGRLAVALALDDEPKEATPAPPMPFPLPSPSPSPLGRVGMPP
jgi:hypothetical protein